MEKLQQMSNVYVESSQTIIGIDSFCKLAVPVHNLSFTMHASLCCWYTQSLHLSGAQILKL